MQRNVLILKETFANISTFSEHLVEMLIKTRGFGPTIICVWVIRGVCDEEQLKQYLPHSGIGLLVC